MLTHLHEDAGYLPISFETNKALFNAELGGVGFLSNQYEIPFADMYWK